MATHSSILAWRIPRTREPGGLQPTGLRKVGLNWSDCARRHARMMPKSVHFLVASFRLELRRNKYELASLFVLVAGMHCAWSREELLRFRGARIRLTRLQSDAALPGPHPCSETIFRLRPQWEPPAEGDVEMPWTLYPMPHAWLLYVIFLLTDACAAALWGGSGASEAALPACALHPQRLQSSYGWGRSFTNDWPTQVSQPLLQGA